MIISQRLKTIFIHVHRTGGTGFTNVLKKHAQATSYNSLQHNNARTLESSFFEEHHDYSTFGFTRNPWERIFSWYSLIHAHNPKSLAEEKIRFEKFIETDLTRDLTTQFFHYNTLDYFTTLEGKLIADKILRYEHLEKEVKAFSNQYNLNITEIPVVNSTKSRNYKEYYTSASKDLITEKCKKDIEYFNYRF